LTWSFSGKCYPTDSGLSQVRHFTLQSTRRLIRVFFEVCEKRTWFDLHGTNRIGQAEKSTGDNENVHIHTLERCDGRRCRAVRGKQNESNDESKAMNMKRMIKKISMVGVCMMTLTGAAQTAVIIGQDNFDGTSTYLSRSFKAANNQAVTWAIVNRTNAKDPINDISKYRAFGSAGDGTDNDGFLKSTKTDSFFGLYRGGATAPRTLTYTFDIAGYTDLNLAMDWAASGDIAPPGITMTYSIDGSAPTTIFVIGTAPTKWVQTMEDGRSVTNNRSATVTVNDVAGTSLSEFFQTYTPMIAGTGSVLTLTLSMTSGTAGPAYGMDNLELYGTSLASDSSPNPINFRSDQPEVKTKSGRM